LYCGFEDSDFKRNFTASVKWTPVDNTMQILLQDQSTEDWNPLIFAIFYGRLEIVKYFCESELVSVRNCLTTPFIIVKEGSELDDANEEEYFIKEKTEVFVLVLCIMVELKEIFAYLWTKCAYIWNEIHLILLANYLYDAKWTDGLAAFFTSPQTHQLFASMSNLE
jgi:hypothetical protein